MAMRSVPGYASCLTRITLEVAVPLEVRQLAAVVLRQFIRIHWSESADSFTEPAPSENEKAAVRAVLTNGLSDETPRIRTAVSMVIASIAAFDWPDAWPNLMSELVRPLEDAARSPVADPAAAATVAGVLRCLELCSSELQVPPPLPMLAVTRATCCCAARVLHAVSAVPVVYYREPHHPSAILLIAHHGLPPHRPHSAIRLGRRRSSCRKRCRSCCRCCSESSLRSRRTRHASARALYASLRACWTGSRCSR